MGEPLDTMAEAETEYPVLIAFLPEKKRCPNNHPIPRPPLDPVNNRPSVAAAPEVGSTPCSVASWSNGAW